MREHRNVFFTSAIAITAGIIALEFLDFSPISFSLIFVLVALVIMLLRAIAEFFKTKEVAIMHKILGHFSVVLLTFAVLFNHQYSESVDLKLKPGQSTEFADSSLEFKSIEILGKENFDTVVANFYVKDKNFQADVISEKRVYKIGGIITSETGIASFPTKDYHIVLGDRFQDGSWSIRYSINYGIMMIWASSFLLLFSMLYGTIRRYGY